MGGSSVLVPSEVEAAVLASISTADLRGRALSTAVGKVSASSLSDGSSSCSLEAAMLLLSVVWRDAVAVLGSGEMTPMDSSSSMCEVLADLRC